MDRYIGKLLDNRYEIEQLIGSGGMANVYKARCRLLNRDVAVKILKDECAKDEDFKKRFRNESLAVAKLSHQNIVSVFDVSKTEDFDYIVMELVEGITLKDYLTKKGALSIKETLFFIEQIARGLNHAHSRNIVHQDIKPQNILLLKDGSAKVTDFGIAKIMGHNETQVIQETMGSVHYISPEQARGSTIDNRADIYSLGVMMYEMLTGKLPFDGDSAVAIVMQHINAIPLLPSEVNEDIPQAMDGIVMKCMNPIAGKRYFTAMELYNDLQLYKENPNMLANHGDIGRDDSMGETMAISTEGVTKAISRNGQSQGGRSQGNRSQGQGDRNKSQSKKEMGTNQLSMPLIAGSITLFVFLTVAFSIYSMFTPTDHKLEMVLVPKLVNLNVNELELEEAYPDFLFTIEEKDIADETVIDGTILIQAPEAESKLEKGKTITLTVAKQTVQMRTVPVVKDMTERDALAEIWSAGITNYSIDRQNSEKIEKGKVISTLPEAGETLGKETPLVLVISDGKVIQLVKMPDLTGSTQQAAAALLKAEGLQLGNVKNRESTGPAGIVIEQTVAKGVEVSAGTVVDIVISIAPVAVPDPEPEPKPEPEPEGSVSMTIKLPTVKPQVTVLVRDDSGVLYEKTHDTKNGVADILLRGTGSTMVTVEIDGEYWASEVVTFK